MRPPLVTIGIALYNHQDYIAQCINSVLNQSYKNIELIIIDDGSPDQSFDHAQACVNAHPHNDCVTLLTRANQGMCNTLNEIAKLSHGEYISFVGSDDYWAPTKISDQVAFLESHPNVALVHSNSIKINSEGSELGLMDHSQRKNSGNLYEAIIKKKGGINTPSHLYRTAVYETIGYYDPNFKFEDTDFWLRLTNKLEVGFINKTHTYYRWHGNNLSNSNNALNFYYDELTRIYRKNIPDRVLLHYAIRRLAIKGFSKSIKRRDWVNVKKYAWLLSRGE